MASRDVLQVLRGLSKVVEQVVQMQAPELRQRVVPSAKAFAGHVPPVRLEAKVGHARTEPAMKPAPSAAANAGNQDGAEGPLPSPPRMQHQQPLAETPAANTASRPLIVHDQVKRGTGATLQHPEREAAAGLDGNTASKSSQRSSEVPRPPHPEMPNEADMGEPNTAAWKEKRVPSSPLSRILGFGGLAARLAMGTAAEMVRTGGQQNARQAFVSDTNVERLTETLCTMRGAALKLGQMLSIQDENLVSPKLAATLDRVRQNAHIMPKKQLHKQLEKELGDKWREQFEEFDDNPIAAASIGQVHRAMLPSGERVAVKIQYPGVAESIGSDLLNLKRLISYTNLLPRGLYIDEIIRVAQQELILECDYEREATQQERFRGLVHASGMDPAFIVPKVYRKLTTPRVFTSELISGVPVDKVAHLPQDVRNRIARNILELTVRELFEWRFMQTDPNWSNYLYNANTHKMGLVDFGAAREYSQEFVDDYFQIVWAAANQDEATLVKYSLKMKFLTGDETAAMMRAHILAGMVVGEPFRSNAPFDFVQSKLTKRLADYSGTFLHGRLTPPPREVYSLHRKLAGAFLMCIKLGAVVPCRDVLEQIAAAYSEDIHQAEHHHHSNQNETQEHEQQEMEQEQGRVAHGAPSMTI